MNCPACNKILASTLSVCTSCGAMVHDTVREELAAKISPMEKTSKIEAEKAEIISRAEIAKAESRLAALGALRPNPNLSKRAETPKVMASNTTAPPPIVLNPPPAPIVMSKASVTPKQELPPVQMTIEAPQPPPQKSLPPVVMPSLSMATTKPHTSEFVSKPTSPTLVEFQNKNAVLPEWRLQLQNSIRRRNGGAPMENQVNTTAVTSMQTRQSVLVTSGANAMQAETIEQIAPTAAPGNAAKLEKALKRIEESRQKYATAEETPKPSVFDAFQQSQQSQQPQTQQRTFPYVVPELPLKQTVSQPTVNTTPKPRLAAPLTEVKVEKFDTNKLPPIPAKISSSFEKRPVVIIENESKIDEQEIKSFQIKASDEPDVVAYEETQVIEGQHEEAVDDDRAPIALRFNAGLFDILIGSFLSVVLLAPFMLSSGNLFTIQGLFAFLATCSIVMFIYLTTTIGTMGRTFGMKLFSLELIDIEENAYPTFHQAAVNSSVYLVSLALGGLGFLTVFLNHEKRAAHDLVSGTIVVKEFE